MDQNNKSDKQNWTIRVAGFFHLWLKSRIMLHDSWIFLHPTQISHRLVVDWADRLKREFCHGLLQKCFLIFHQYLNNMEPIFLTSCLFFSLCPLPSIGYSLGGYWASAFRCVSRKPTLVHRVEAVIIWRDGGRWFFFFFWYVLTQVHGHKLPQHLNVSIRIF